MELPMIYHEKQQERLCGVHCLNSLLQGHYFTAVDLMMIAREIDDAERRVMLEMGSDTKDFLKFMAEDSGNVADDGNYSVQVLAKALSVWGLTPIPITNPEVKSSRANPLGETGFICNLAQHWLTIRKIGDDWYNLNSLLDDPQYLSPFYLSAFMDTLIAQGYTIFVIQGSLPRVMPEAIDKSWKKAPRKSKSAYQSNSPDKDLEEAIRLSMESQPQSNNMVVDEDEEMKLAILMSQETKPPQVVAEPEKGEGVAELTFRLPTGTSLHRRFLATNTLQDVSNYLTSAGVSRNKSQLVSTFPRKEYTNYDATLKELDLCPGAVIIVQDKK